MLDKLKNTILDISMSDIIDIAITEFIYIMDYKIDETNTKIKCACNRPASSINIFYNLYTEKFLILGDGCYKYIKKNVVNLNYIKKLDKSIITQIIPANNNYNIIECDSIIELCKSYLERHQKCVDCIKFIPKCNYKVRCFDCYRVKNTIKCLDCDKQIPYSKYKKLCVKCYIHKNN